MCAPPDEERPPAEPTGVKITGEVVTGKRSTVGADATSWAGRIRPHLIAAADAIFAAGTELLAAKADLPHGKFGPLLDELGISQSMANRFMRVAGNEVLNRAPVHGLPAAVSVLDELSKLDDAVLQEVIDNGEVHAGLTRDEARAIVARHRPPSPTEAATLVAAAENLAASVRSIDEWIDGRPGAFQHRGEVHEHSLIAAILWDKGRVDTSEQMDHWESALNEVFSDWPAIEVVDWFALLWIGCAITSVIVHEPFGAQLDVGDGLVDAALRWLDPRYPTTWGDLAGVAS